MTTSRSSINAFMFLTLFVSSCFVAHAQYTRTAERGFQPSGSYAVGDFETINTSNGNVMLNIPLAGLPAGRGGLSAKVNLVYDSKLYNTNTTYSNCPAVPAGAGLLPRTPPYPGCGGDPGFPSELLAFSTEGGWRYNFKYTLRSVFSSYDGHVSCNPQQPTAVDIIKMQVVYPDGSTHDFRLSGYTEPDGMQPNYFPMYSNGTITANSHCQGYSNTTNNLVYYSIDGTYARLEVEHATSAWTLYLPDGSRVTSPTASQGQRIYDRNNNYIEIVTTGFTYNGNPATKIFDQLGRQVIIENIASTNTDLIHAWGVGNQELIWTIKWKTISINKSYHSGWGGLVSIPSFQKNRRVVDQIILPAIAGQTAQAYTFGYNAGTANPSLGWGEVSSITTPRGAQVSYIWAMDGVNGTSALAVFNNTLVRKDLSYLAEFDGSSSLVTDQWFYSVNQDSGVTQITGPNSAVTTEHFLPGETRGFKTEKPDGSIVERIWAYNNPYGYPHGFANNIVKTEFTSIRDAAGNLSRTVIVDYKYDKNGNVTQTTEYNWVDWHTVPRDGSGKPTGIPGGAVINRVSVNGFYNQTADSTDTVTNDPNSYIYAAAPRLLRAPSWNEIKWGHATNGSQTLTRGEFFYDNADTTGNLTQQKRWDSTKGAYSNPLGANSISVSTQYNSYGSPTLTTDARGYQTQFYYGTVGAFTDLYPTQIKTAYSTSVQRTETREYDFYTGVVTRVTDVDNNVSTVTSYDVFGRPTLVRAAADKPEETRTATEYSDFYRRVINRSDLNTVGDAKLVSIQHYDQLGRVRLSRQLEDSASQNAEDETAGIKVQTRYINSGANSYQLVSNPYRAANSSSASSEPEMGWTRTKSDKGGRILEVQTFTGAGLPTPWGSNASHSGVVTTSYDSEFTTVTDQAGKKRRSMVDGLGRLIRVDEPDASNNLGSSASPVQPTNYTYNGLDSLVKVIQGSQTRYFMYDSLKRLIRARNPEQDTHASQNLSDPLTGNSQWSLGYQYDNNGNLSQKTDARGTVSLYAYDALNRNTTVDYSNTTINPDITRSYDGAARGIGRLWQTYSGGTETTGATVEHLKIHSYDFLGRPLDQRQRFKTNSVWSGEYQTQRTYNVANVSSQTYPSGHTVNFAYDAAGRLTNFTGNLGDGAQRNYATNISYNSTGQWTREQFGTQTALYNKRHFNSRGQLYDMRLGTVNDAVNYNRGAIINYYSLANYGFGTTGPDTNGNVYVQQHFVPNDDAVTGHTFMQQNYDYDSLNRLRWVAEYQNGATETGSQNFAYDRWGNRTISSASGTGINNKSFTVNTSNNRLGVPSGQSGTMGYDPAGNLTVDTYSASAVTRAYDAENRMTSETQAGSLVAGSYTYNADGQRVRRKVNAAETWQVYGVEGELLAEYAAGGSAASPQKEYGYRNGELLITAEAGAANTGPENVVWTSAVGVSASGNNLTKTGSVGWNAGAVSTQSIASGDGYVEFTANSNSANTMCGLSHGDTNQSYEEIDFALYPWIDGNLYVFENGVSRGSVGPYTAGDVFRVAVDAGAVKYRKNGALLYTSVVTPTYPLLVDTTLYPSGSQITTAVISSGGSGDGQQNAAWTNSIGVSTSGNNLTKMGGDGWNAGAVSTQTISSGDGYVELTASETTTARMIGLGNGDTNQSYTDIEYAFKLGGGGNLDIWEAGNPIAWVSTYAPGDLLRVAVEGGVVKYRKNGTLLYSSTVTPTYPLLVDTSLYYNGSTLTNVVISSGSGDSSPSAEINWLVTDHLGTPRIIADETGSLAGIKRHDYLPFGEELFAGTGGRTLAKGYSADAVRQKFTSKERDIETGLDYFLARYYSSTQGRFTSVDPEQAGARTDDPQSWNGYAYARNSPLVYTDPFGLDYRVCSSDGKECVTYTDKQFDKLKKGGPQDGYTFKDNKIYYYGELTATYSNDCLSCEGLVNGIAQRAPAMQKAILIVGALNLAPAVGIVGSMTAGGSGLVTLGTLGRAAPATGAGGTVLSQLGPKDAAIIEKTLQYGGSATNSFLSNVEALTRATLNINSRWQVYRIGQIGNSPIFGGKSGVGIAEVNGRTVIVKMVHGNPQVLGPLQ